MSTYKTNMISFLPYGKRKKYKAKKDSKGRTVVSVKRKNGTYKKYKFDKDAGVIL